MIVLGKTDYRSHDDIGLDLFSGNRSLVSVDVTTLQDLYPEYVGHYFPCFTPLTGLQVNRRDAASLR
jgi:hypothetical protein